jgi:hypothetical protein
VSPTRSPSGAGAFKAAVSGMMTFSKQRKKKGEVIVQKSQPYDFQGKFISHPDMSKPDPRDYLLIGRVVLK